MKKRSSLVLNSTFATVILAAAIGLIATPSAMANTARWIAIPGVSANTNWSDNLNWTNSAGGGPGSTNNDVLFGATGAVGTAGEVNNVVDTKHQSFSLTYTNVNGLFHTTEIPGGIALTNATGLTVGGVTANGLTTIVNMSGAGTLVQLGNINIGNSGSSSANSGTLLNLSALSNFVHVASNGTFNVGVLARGSAEFNFAAVSNNITVSNMVLNSSTSSGASGTVRLGTGTNIINAATINVGFQRSSCTVSFFGATGELRLRGLGGTDSDRANMTLGNRNVNTSGGTDTATLSFNGHAVDLKLGTLTMGQAINGAPTGSQGANGIINFDTGTIDATTINMAIASANAFNNGNATINVGATGTLIAGSGGISLVNQGTLGTATGNLNISGGTVNCSGNIFKTTAAGTANLTLSSGLLDMQPAGDATPGSISADTLSVGTGGTGVITNAAMISATTFTIGASGSVAGATTINVTSGGSLDVSAVSGFALAGNQRLQGSGTVSGAVIQNTGASISVGTNGTTGTLAFNSDLTLNAGGNLAFDLDTPGVNDSITVGGNLVLAGTNNVSLTAVGGGFVNGTYTLMTYSGTLSGNATCFQVIGPIAQGRQSFTFDTNTPGQINLVVAGTAGNLTWVGDGVANTWNLIGATNWTSGSPDVFYNFDGVTIDDTGSDSPAINLVGTLLPGSVTVTNDAKNFALSGSGKISGTTGLTKLGTGALTIANSGTNDFTGTITVEGGTLAFDQGADTTVANVIAGSGLLVKTNTNTLSLNGVNTYTSNTVVSAGTLKVNNNASLGSLVGGTVTVAGGASLDLGGNATANNANYGAKEIRIAGSGVGGNGAIINSSSVQQINALQKVTLTGNATFGGPGSFFTAGNPGRWDIRGGTPVLDLAGNKLTKVGTNQISMVSVSITDGDIDLNTGILSMESASFVTNSGTITVNSNGYLGHFRLALGSFTRPIVLNGGTITNLTTTGIHSTNDALITLTAYSTLGGSGGSNTIVLNGVITNTGGAFGLTKVGGGVFELGGVSGNTYTGNTTNLGGTLVLNKTSGDAIPAALVIPAGTVTNALNNQIADSAPVTVSGGTLALGANSDTVGAVTLESGTISGGTLTGSSYGVQNGTISANLAGGGVAMVKTTANTVILSGANTYDGGSAINAGSLRANVSGSPYGSGVVTVADGAVAYLSAAGLFPNTFSLAGIGPVEASGSFGALRLATGGALVTNTATLTANTRIGSRGSGATGGILGGLITGPYALELNYLGDSTSGSLTLSNANNNWTGDTTILHGTLRLGLSEVIPNGVSAGNVILTNSWTNTATILDLNGASETVNGLSTVGSDPSLCVITNGSVTASTLTAGDNAASSTFGGLIKAGAGVINLTKIGGGTLTLTAANTYSGATTVSNGTLALTGAATISSSIPITVGAGATLDASGTTFGQLALSSGQTLRGNGTVNGILIAASGATVSPGTSIGRLTVSSPVNLLNGSTTLMELDAANGTNDVLASTSSINLNGTLTVTNIAGTLAGGQSYKLFSGTLAGNFTVTNLPALGGGLSWDWNPTTGILSIVGSSVNTTPTNIVSSVAGGNLTLSWPSDHIGWSLLVQTNLRSVGLNTNWFVVPDSSTTNQVTVPISTSTPTVFYRLVYP